MKPYPEWDGKKYYRMPTYEMTMTGGAVTKKYEVIRFGVQGKKDGTIRVVGLAQNQRHGIKMWIPTYKVHSVSSPENGAWKVYDNFLIHDGPDHMPNAGWGSIGCIEVGGLKGFYHFNSDIIEMSGLMTRAEAEELSRVDDRAKSLSKIGNSGKMTIHYEAAVRPKLERF